MHHDLGEAAAGLTDKQRLESLARPIITRLLLLLSYNVIISSYHYHVANYH